MRSTFIVSLLCAAALGKTWDTLPFGEANQQVTTKQINRNRNDPDNNGFTKPDDDNNQQFSIKSWNDFERRGEENKPVQVFQYEFVDAEAKVEPIQEDPTKLGYRGGSYWSGMSTQATSKAEADDQLQDLRYFICYDESSETYCLQYTIDSENIDPGNTTSKTGLYKYTLKEHYGLTSDGRKSTNNNLYKMNTSNQTMTFTAQTNSNWATLADKSTVEGSLTEVRSPEPDESTTKPVKVAHHIKSINARISRAYDPLPGLDNDNTLNQKWEEQTEMYHIIGFMSKRTGGVTNKRSRAVDTFYNATLWNPITKDELYDGNNPLKPLSLYRGDIDVVKQYLRNSLSEKVPSLTQTIEEQRNAFVLPDKEKCTEAEKTDAKICQCEIKGEPISPCNYIHPILGEADFYWTKVQGYLKKQFETLENDEKANVLDEDTLNKISTTEVLNKLTIEDAKAQASKDWKTMTDMYEKSYKDFLEDHEAAQNALIINVHGLNEQRISDNLKLSQEQANLIKSERDLAAFMIILEEKYSDKFGDEERDSVNKWKEASEGNEESHIEPHQISAYKLLTEADLSILSPFCPAYPDPNQPGKNIGFDADTSEPKRTNYKIEECTMQKEALKRTSDIVMGKDYKPFSNTDYPEEAVAVREAEKKVQGALSAAEEVQKAQTKQFKDMGTMYDLYSTYQKYGFEKEGAVALTGYMTALVVATGAVLF